MEGAPSPPAREGASGTRLAWLDVARGIAASIVVFQHVLEGQVAAFREFTANVLNFGQAGVAAFFFVSGYVIPFSVERAGSLRKFWTSRFFRLYPLYWFAFGLVLLLGPHTTGLFGAGFDPNSAKHLAINATMIQEAIRIPNGLGVFWTLGLEMIFYGICTLLFALRWNKRSLAVLYAFGGLIAILGVVAPYVLGHRLPVGGRFFYILIAMLGTIVFRYLQGEATAKQLVTAFCFLVVLDAGLCLTFQRFMGEGGGFDVQPLAIFTSFLLGAAIFFGVFAFRNRPMARILMHIGLVSYSIYLLHPFVGHYFPATPWPLLNAALVFAATVLASTITFRLIEKPFQTLGKRLAKRIPSPSP